MPGIHGHNSFVIIHLTGVFRA